MAKMVRKQIYIEARHEQKLKRIAESRGLSQAEIIRKAIDDEAAEISPGLGTDPAAWEQALRFMQTLQRKGRKPRRRPWKREDLYDERLGRHDRGLD